MAELMERAQRASACVCPPPPEVRCPSALAPAGGVKAKDPLAGENVAYSWHIYANTDDDDEQQWASRLDELQTVAPVMVTEWGFQEHTKEDFRGTAKSFGSKFVRDFLEGRHLHSTAWCWHPDWTPVMLKLDWKTPTPMGRFVMNYLTWPEGMGAAKSPVKKGS